MTILTGLGDRIAGITATGLEPRCRNLVRTALIDTIGVALAGTDTDGFRIARGVVGITPGPALVLGSADRANVLDAAMLNAIAAHALDYDDNNIVVVGHPSVLLVPAVLALGDQLDATIEDLTVGYAAGYEAMLRVARGVNPAHYDKGWHPTATTGVFGVAAAASRMVGLDGKHTAVALAIAASMAAGVKANFGTMTKALHIGQATRNGLLAARLAGAGLTANTDALEGEQGFLRVYNGDDRFNVDAIVPAPGEPYEVNRGINPVKAFPCCGSTHGAVLAALDLRDEPGVDIADIARIDVAVDPRRMPHTNRPVLDEALAGKFSVQYVVARAFVDGRVGLDHFAGDAHRDPSVMALMERVEVVPATGGHDNSFSATVTVETAGGASHTAIGDERRLVHIPEPQLWAKFADCAGIALPPNKAEQAAKMLSELDGATRVRDLTSVLAGHGLA